MPLVERITTVTGSCITEPKNLVTRVGTLVSEIIEQCGGFKEGKTVGKIIIGGPMMGIAQYTINIPINKGASGILCLDKQESENSKATKLFKMWKVSRCMSSIFTTIIYKCLFIEK